MDKTGSQIPVMELDAVSVDYDGHLALENASFQVCSGEVMGLIGPNGAGKSTALKAAIDLVSHQGTTRFFGGTLEQHRKQIAYMPQAAEVDWDYPITVEKVVAMGRYPHRGWFRGLSREDKQIVGNCLEQVGIADLAKRQIAQLSGGQRRRVFVARVLAQEPRLYLLDEPFAGIDVASEKVIREVLRNLRDGGATVVIVHHDLSTVRELCDTVTMIHRGVVCSGPVETVFTTDNINATFGLGL